MAGWISKCRSFLALSWDVTAARGFAKNMRHRGRGATSILDYRFRSLSEFDVVERAEGWLPAPVAQVLFAGVCIVALVLVRALVDLVAPAGPFALIYPTVLIATLYGRWGAGLITYLAAFAWTWFFVLPDSSRSLISASNELSRLIVNGMTVMVILVFAELFRAAVRHAAHRRDREIANRDLLLRELDHRTKNNFMIVASLLALQKRRETSPEAQAALSVAAARVDSFAAAHQALHSLLVVVGCCFFF